MSAPTTGIKLNKTIPAAPTGQQNVVFQSDGGTPQQQVTAYDPLMVGDTGSGGSAGNVPAPAAGDAAAGRYLKADGTFSIPPGTGASPITTEGDLIAGGATGVPTRVAAGTPGQLLQTNGTSALPSWVTPGVGISITNVPIPTTPVTPFTLAHGLGVTPVAVIIQPTIGGQIWLQTPTSYDATNIYLVPSDAGLTAIAVCFH